MNNLHRNIERGMSLVDTVFIVIAKLMLCAMVLVTFLSVIGRTFFNTPLPDDLLISEMLMVALVFLPLSWVQSQGAHLEVTVLTDFLPKPVQTLLVSIGLLLGLAVFGTMTYVSWMSAHDAFVFDELAYNSVLDLRDWPAKMLIPLGLAWWCLRILTQLLWPASRPDDETEFDAALRDTADLAKKP
ncbi:TRAP transporter small permease [Alloalcanivorax mobilis]|uniref:TRAP transporter small permease n=1 Tax=Alloalcanivorax mobilis TaxID=2019569 RepID=UPI001E2B9253|nr:TRAP transporter small permease [Alloalcanivorax mobilis]